MLRDQILGEIDGLITEGNTVVASYSLRGHQPESSLPEPRLMSFRASAVAAVERIAGNDSEYYKHLPPVPQGAHGLLRIYKEVMEPTLGVLMALRTAVDRDLLVRLEQRVRSNTYDDFLEQADELLKAKPSYAVAAMVLVGGVLEDHLRKLCLARSIEWKGKNGITAYNDALKEVVYPQVTWRRCQVVGDNRNAAAHGGEEAAKLKHDDVQDDLRWVRKLMAEYQA
jgi:hypothetical protein